MSPRTGLGAITPLRCALATILIAVPTASFAIGPGCGDLDVPNSNSAVCAGTPSRSICFDFRCLAGYEPSGPAPGCTFDFLDPSSAPFWAGVPTCSPVACDEPASEPNGTWSGTFELDTPSTLSCDPGFAPSVGLQTSTCVGSREGVSRWADPLAALASCDDLSDGLTVIDQHGFHVVDVTEPADETYEIRDGECFRFSPEFPCTPDLLPAPAEVEFRNTGMWAEVEVYETSTADVVGGHFRGLSAQDQGTLHLRLPEPKTPASGPSFIGDDEAHIRVHSGRYRVATLNDRSRLTVEGGGILATFLHDRAHIRHVGGFLRSHGEGGVTLHDDATMEMIGGEIFEGWLYGWQRAQVTMTGGLVSFISLNDDSEMHMAGGTAVDIVLSNQARLTLVGSDFIVDGVPVGPGPVTEVYGRIAGTLASGDALDSRLHVDDDAVLQLVQAPEPTGALPALAVLLTLGTLGRRATRQAAWE